MAKQSDGLYLRGKDKNIWWLDCVINGQRYQLSIGKGISRSIARELVAIKRTEIMKGNAGIGKKRKDGLFEKVKAEYLAWVKANKRPGTYRVYTQSLDQLATLFDGMRLSQISGFSIEKFKRTRADGGARVRANRDVAVLKSMFNFAIRMNLFEGANPAVGVKPFKEPKHKLRFLEPEEEEALVAQLKEPLRTLVIVGIHTGIRIQSEGLSLTWAHVDLRRNLLMVDAIFSKNGEQRTIPLNQTARQALSHLRETATQNHVFVTRTGDRYRNIRNSFGRACERAGVIGVSPHTLRHTFASRLAMAGVDLRAIQELGGWKDIGMVMRYAHLSPGHKAEAVQRIALDNSPTILPTPTIVSIAQTA